MAYPVFYHYDPNFRLALYGKRRIHNRALAYFHKADYQKICLVKAASDSTHPGFCQIVDPVYNQRCDNKWDIFADATILTEPGSSASIFTADCCSLVVYEATTHILGLAHCGRAAMTPQNQSGEKIDNIVTRLIETMTKRVDGTPLFVAVTTGSITPKNFPHDEERARKLIEPFEQFGPIAFGDKSKGELNIPAIIRNQLLNLGVKARNIIHDNLCTHDHPQLHSYRRACRIGLDPTERNAVVVVLT
jgi:copper oxidase (laccase) domain-containing protein